MANLPEQLHRCCILSSVCQFLFFFSFLELCCQTKLRYHALAAGCYNSFFGEGEERNHRDCRHRGSAHRFTGEGLCNPMLNSASDLRGSCVKPVCFSCLYFCCTPQKLMIAHGVSALAPSRHKVRGCSAALALPLPRDS